jgi:pyruvate/2-oxoglutarate dehydrogenase complex dihydrolipoamide dehydrogenase (E3) component
MSQPEKYDLVVLGSGEGGKFIAWSLGSQGKRSAVVERQYVGGSSPNIACLPSKNVIQRAKVVSYFHRGSEFGITTGAWKVEMPAVQMVDGLIASHLEKYRQNNAELVMGRAASLGRRRSKWWPPKARRALSAARTS